MLVPIKLHGVTSQKTLILTFTAITASSHHQEKVTDPRKARCVGVLRLAELTKQSTVTSYKNYTERNTGSRSIMHRTLHYMFVYAEECRNNIMSTEL